MSQRLVVVFATGAGDVEVPPGAIVVAADGGAEAAVRAGVDVDVAVGDFDSLSGELLAELERSGMRIERHPANKDATDLELALDAALALGPDRILVAGDAGGRLDHLLGILLLLGAEKYAAVFIDAQLGAASIHVVRGERTLQGAPGETISLFALHGPAHGVTTHALAYPLGNEDLAAGGSRGCSNEFAAAEAKIQVRSGVVICVRPDSAAAGSAPSSPSTRTPVP